MAELRWRYQHLAVGDVTKVLSKASRELLLVQRQLEQDFQRSYPENDLIDKARTTLAGQRDSLQMILSSSGLPSMSESNDIAYTSLNQVIDEWTAQVRSKDR